MDTGRRGHRRLVPPALAPSDRSADINDRTRTRTRLRRIAALGGVALLATGSAACQVAESAGAGFAVSDAIDELLSREALTVGATLDAGPDEIYAYLTRAAESRAAEASSAEEGGGDAEAEPPTLDEARLLSDLELTFSVGDPEEETLMRDLAPEDPRNSSLTVNFGGRDVLGLKQVEDTTYLRVGAEAIVEDVYGGDEATVARAERFAQDAGQLPESLADTATGLAGDWVEVDPYQYPAYADALAEHGGVAPETAHDLAATVEDGDALLQPQRQWDVVGQLRNALEDGATTHHEGESRGAERVALRMTADQARSALGPLLNLLDEQVTRYDLPPVIGEPAPADAEVEAELAIRNGVLAEATFDLGQLDGGDAGSLPLRLSLAGGAALSLSAPESAGPVSPEDLTVALLYLRVREEQRIEDEDRADLPGPMQP
ncbi:hypothetical protein FH609_028870 [Streptomyces sp. 3MP-14]|uniref:Uncharacterized protein n=1 Tax=Streptomyces mimosae TaxID=2586635 RepID=A0A5N5ZN11_9ACTN|nr:MULTISPECIES: hypothetical protein [Streptomyces]KAB8157086.1 hypothetical protein FH607_030440 [Streptomyces mimosae]KAB8172709.1 hypothetical protein FH609_028870 [Streptomyces sp. 3MP-14]